VKVLFFGPLRELTSVAEETVELPASTALCDVFDRYCARFPKLAGFRASLVASQNQEFAPWDARVADGDTIAFLPPVSGG
jgi:molybdopterin converting factor subunit 1